MTASSIPGWCLSSRVPTFKIWNDGKPLKMISRHRKARICLCFCLSLRATIQLEQPILELWEALLAQLYTTGLQAASSGAPSPERETFELHSSAPLLTPCPHAECTLGSSPECGTFPYPIFLSSFPAGPPAPWPASLRAQVIA